MHRRVVFDGKVLPYLLLAPQLLVTTVFFFWPAGQAVYYSFLLQDAFGLRQNFVWFDNFRVLLADPLYRGAAGRTVVFTLAVTVLSMAPALLLAVMADKRIRGSTAYKTLLIWPYAVAPAVAAVLWLFIFHPSIGVLGQAVRKAGVAWDYKLNGVQAMCLVVLAASWKQVAYNFLFFLAGLQSIPKSLIEAAAIGLPAVASRIYGVVDAVTEGETGLLYAVGDSADLGAKLQQLLADEGLRRRLGTAAHARAEAEFPQETLVRALADRYREILGA